MARTVLRLSSGADDFSIEGATTQHLVIANGTAELLAFRVGSSPQAIQGSATLPDFLGTMGNRIIWSGVVGGNRNLYVWDGEFSAQVSDFTPANTATSRFIFLYGEEGRAFLMLPTTGGASARHLGTLSVQ